MDRAALVGAAFDASGASRPNLFIAGAPKCATTATAEALAAHPNVFLSDPKEPHCFGADLPDQRVRTLMDPAEYAGLFRGAGDATVIAEASVWTMRSATAAGEIHAFAPGARILILLRNPTDMLASLHTELCRAGVEDLADLREALDAEEDRRSGRRIPRGVANHGQLLYSEAVAFPTQVRRFLDAFGPSSLHVVLFDDIEKDPQGVCSDVQRFLGLTVDGGVVLARRNEGRGVRHPRLQRLARQQGVARSLSRRLVPQRARPHIAKTLLRGVERVNLADGRPPISDRLRAELCDRFRAQTRELAALIDRDLSAWLDPVPQSVNE